jgi:hypothetical protein
VTGAGEISTYRLGMASSAEFVKDVRVSLHEIGHISRISEVSEDNLDLPERKGRGAQHSTEQSLGHDSWEEWGWIIIIRTMHAVKDIGM